MLKVFSLSGAAALALSLGAMPAAAAGQSSDGEVEQIGAAGSSAQMRQIGREDVDLAVPQPSAEARGEATPQISRVRDSRGAPSQLTREEGHSSPPDQLYRGGRTAQPAAPLSRPSEGRTSAVARVEGDDRCDPAAEDSAERRRLCAHVIETRSAEFVRAEPVRSAEENLLIDQQMQERSDSIDGAARRLADNSGDPNSQDEQGIASIVLADPAPVRQATPEEEPSSEAMTVIEAIVGAMNGVPPSP